MEMDEEMEQEYAQMEGMEEEEKREQQAEEAPTILAEVEDDVDFDGAGVVIVEIEE